jgi:hypothetical protein
MFRPITTSFIYLFIYFLFLADAYANVNTSKTFSFFIPPIVFLNPQAQQHQTLNWIFVQTISACY